MSHLGWWISHILLLIILLKLLLYITLPILDIRWSMKWKVTKFHGSLNHQLQLLEIRVVDSLPAVWLALRGDKPAVSLAVVCRSLAQLAQLKSIEIPWWNSCHQRSVDPTMGYLNHVWWIYSKLVNHVWLVVFTLLKNDGVRQLGWWTSQLIWKNNPNVPVTTNQVWDLNLNW